MRDMDWLRRFASRNDVVANENLLHGASGYIGGSVCGPLLSPPDIK
jgi:hypothetical protein